jgi:hypothetical protein
MNTHKQLRSLILGVISSLMLWTSVARADQPATAVPAAATSAAAPKAAAKATFGAVVGIVRNSAKLPVAEATVTAIRMDGGGVRATVSGSDGTYSFADLPPGSWSLTFKADGYPDATAPASAVAANQATRVDIVMTGSGPVSAAAAAPAAATAAQAATVPEALQAPEPGPANDTVTPLANVGYLGWMNGTSREASPIFDTKFFTPEIRFDMNYLQSTNNPKDHTIVGSTEEFRSGEFQIEQVSFGGDFHWNNVRGRFLSMMGDFATTTPRNDASAGVGNWDLQGAYKYMSEANAGYHFDVDHGLNVDMGIFVSYIGLFSYYNFDNWTYQPSFVSSNTPWFFNGLRIQWWPTQNLKIEPWIINGWQSYGKYNSHPGLGGQILYIPNENVKWVFNTYFYGQDNQATIAPSPGNGSVDPRCPGITANPNCGGPGVQSLPFNGPNIDYTTVQRFHEDDSFLLKYYDNQESATGLSRMAMSVTMDFGCEHGGNVQCTSGPNKAAFFGIMAYNRFWFDHNVYALTIGGGTMTNPGRYLALTPPINGATAASGTPYFTENPGQEIRQSDVQINLQYMPNDWITWWTEATYRYSNVPYWSGAGGVTPPNGSTGTFSDNGAPGSVVCNNGTNASAVSDSCAAEGGIWYPDLRRSELVWGLGLMVRF